MKIYDGLYIPKGFQPEDKNGFVNLYSDSDMNLRIRNGVVLKGTKISITGLPTESESIALKFSSGIENKNFIFIAFYADGKIDYVDEDVNPIAIIKDDGTPISGYETITLLEEPSDKVYNLLKKYYSIKNKEETIKQLVTQQDNELKFNNLESLVFDKISAITLNGSNGFTIQNSKSKDIIKFTSLQSENPTALFYRLNLGNANYSSYLTYDSNSSKPLFIKNPDIYKGSIRDIAISDGTINNTTIENCTIRNCKNTSAYSIPIPNNNTHTNGIELSAANPYKLEKSDLTMVNLSLEMYDDAEGYINITFSTHGLPDYSVTGTSAFRHPGKNGEQKELYIMQRSDGTGWNIYSSGGGYWKGFITRW